MSERCYYKVENIDSALFKKANEFLDMEDQLRQTQKKEIEARLPKFSMYKGQRGFSRIVTYTGFVFEDQENIDSKVWKTKEDDGNMLSTPNLRTKAGRSMADFLKSFKKTTMWDVYRLLDIKKKSIYGNFYPADIFRYDNRIYILIGSQYRDVFEESNPDAIEITYGEMEKAIHDLNELNKK